MHNGCATKPPRSQLACQNPDAIFETFLLNAPLPLTRATTPPPRGARTSTIRAEQMYDLLNEFCSRAIVSQKKQDGNHQMDLWQKQLVTISH